MLVAKMPRPISESQVVALGLANAHGRSITIIMISKMALDDST